MLAYVWWPAWWWRLLRWCEDGVWLPGCLGLSCRPLIPRTTPPSPPRSPLVAGQSILELQTKVKRGFARRPLLVLSPGWKRLLALSHLRHYAKQALTQGGLEIIIVSYSRPSLMIVATASQLYIYLQWVQCPFSISVIKSVLKCFPRHYEPTCGPSFAALKHSLSIYGDDFTLLQMISWWQLTGYLDCILWNFVDFPKHLTQQATSCHPSLSPTFILTRSLDLHSQISYC